MSLTPVRLRRAFLVVLALRWLPVGLYIAVSVLVMTDRGLSLAQVGLLFAIHSGAVVALELPTGGLADAIGRRRVLLVAAVLFTVSTGLLLVAQTFAVFALAMVVDGVGRALDSGPLEAWYVDEALRRDPDQNLEADLARAGVVLGAAISTGSLLTGGLGALAAAGRLGSLDPLLVPIAAAVVVHVAHAASVAVLVVEHRDAASALTSAAIPGLTVLAAVRGAAAAVWRRPLLRAVVAVEILWGAALSPIEALWQPRAAQLLGDAREGLPVFGLLSAAAWAASAAGAMLVPRLVTAVRGRTDVAAAAMKLAQAVPVLGMAAAGGVWLFAAAYLATYVAHGAANPVHMALLHRRAHDTPRATVLSVNSLCSRGGGILGSVALGAVAHAVGIPPAYTVVALLLFAAAPLYLWGRERPSAAGAVPLVEEPR